ncbi:transposase [Streptomyces sp. NPDC051104]|uniref:transposase n=1 Tax=Streptomyces sp. NPDC051104 TaxID=3155044 RepID=UPI00341E7134
MAAPRKYPDELRERATRLAIEARKDPAGRAGAIKRIADQLDVHPEALRGWVKRAETDEGIVPGATSTDAARIAELEREVKELRRANAILKSASAFFASMTESETRAYGGDRVTGTGGAGSFLCCPSDGGLSAMCRPAGPGLCRGVA